MGRASRWGILAATLALVGSSGCNAINSIGPNCDRSAETNTPVRYTEGTVKSGVYMSAPWDGELLWFPAGMRYELEHGLGEVPRFVNIWLSFDKCGTNESTVAQASGNQAELREVDEKKLVIVNGSCVDYWLLVVAGTGDGEPDAPEEPGAMPHGSCPVDAGM
ncbi:hypothetical protein [Polyangium jinanense]|uniref:Lipoprotein n=1 Tax=Polyangium jinanense TaxID=2829994 RepID=A0A9X4AQM9_9BACT|nr:hypothetical protein [Polyangium jinanense]MDC3954971.1 hypothetical protein [Polyangium jinanense]MDC3981259.1 hypothetical protein [Polyangium jinanense]